MMFSPFTQPINSDPDEDYSDDSPEVELSYWELEDLADKVMEIIKRELRLDTEREGRG